MIMKNMRNCVKNLFSGEVTLKKRELWLIAALCLCAGMISGIKKAPWTHGVQIASNNGNSSGNNSGNGNSTKGEMSMPGRRKKEEQK